MKEDDPEFIKQKLDFLYELVSYRKETAREILSPIKNLSIDGPLILLLEKINKCHNNEESDKVMPHTIESLENNEEKCQNIQFREVSKSKVRTSKRKETKLPKIKSSINKIRDNHKEKCIESPKEVKIQDSISAVNDGCYMEKLFNSISKEDSSGDSIINSKKKSKSKKSKYKDNLEDFNVNKITKKDKKLKNAIEAKASEIIRNKKNIKDATKKKRSERINNAVIKNKIKRKKEEEVSKTFGLTNSSIEIESMSNKTTSSFKIEKRKIKRNERFNSISITPSNDDDSIEVFQKPIESKNQIKPSFNKPKKSEGFKNIQIDSSICEIDPETSPRLDTNLFTLSDVEYD